MLAPVDEQVVMDAPVAEPITKPELAEDPVEMAVLAEPFDPVPAPRKPDSANSMGEPDIFAVIGSAPEFELKQAETDDMELAQIEPADQTAPLEMPEGTMESGDEESFFSSMKSFSETGDGLESGDLTAAPESKASTAMKQALEGLPEIPALDLPDHELIRAAVLKKLQNESRDRMSILSDARDQAGDEVETVQQMEAHATGVENVQKDLRIKEYLAAAGTNLSPGYVPPPDGGSSAVRFLQRIGMLSSPSDPEATSAPQETKTSIMTALESVDPVAAMAMDAKVSPFVVGGYSAPPAGRAVDTNDDRSVAVLGQMARLFASPGISAPGLLGNMPASNAASQMSSQGLIQPSGTVLPAPAPVFGVTPAPAPLVLPQNPPPPPAAGVTPMPGSIAELNQLAGTLPADPDLQDGWEAVASTEQAPRTNTGTDTGAESGIVERLAHIFDPENPDGVGSGGAVRDSSGNPPPITESTGSWDVVSVQAAPSAARVMLTPPAATGQPVASNAMLTAGVLVLGQNAILGKGLPMGSDLLAQNKSCIQKRNGATTFCIEGLNWSEDIQDQLRVNTVMYQGLNAIVRYDNGVATRYHSLFPSDTFPAIVEHYVARMGQPSNVWNRTITPLAAPAQANPTVSWQAYNPATQMHLVLEIRQYDDTRGGFPDEQRGAIMLYNVQAGTIFPQVSAFELMRLRPGPG